MSRTDRILLAAVLAFGAWMFVSPMGIASGDAYRDNDWFTDRAMDAMARDALLHHRQLPIRSHLVGGGFPTVGHPFDGSWSPTILPVLLFGDVIGVKVNLLLLLLLGSWGIWGLARSWLGLGPPAAVLATLGFAFSGWLPSMMLVGFYPQCLFLVSPAILRLLWVEDRRRPRSLILAGFLLFLLLQQAGNAVLAVAFFVALATWLETAAETRSWLPGPALLLVLLITAPLAFAAELGSWLPLAVGWGLAALAFGALPVLRDFGRALLPWLGRGLLVGCVAASLGAGKLIAVSDLLDDAEYVHELSWGWEFWFPRQAHGEPDGRLYRWPLFGEDNPPPPHSDPDFYGSLGGLLQGLLWRAPTEGVYEPFPAPSSGVPFEERPLGVAEHEYDGIGLTAPILVLALVGLVAGRRRKAVLAVLGGSIAGICLGPHLLPDLHFLMVKGLPGFERIVQPLKYFNFFLVPVGALAAGLGLERLLGSREQLAWGALPLLLALPFVHNGSGLAARFAEPVDAGPREDFHQVAQVGHPDWVGWEPVEIERWGQEYMLRELARPEQAREYWGVKRGVGVVDWYGTIQLPEAAIPKRYVTPSGSWHDNPRYPGAEAWLQGGEGSVEAVRIGPTRIHATVQTEGNARLVVNQNRLPGFGARGGTLVEEPGLLAVDLVGPGKHEVRLVYRPVKLLAGLGASLAALIFWGLAWRRLGADEPPTRAATSSEA